MFLTKFNPEYNRGKIANADRLMASEKKKN